MFLLVGGPTVAAALTFFYNEEKIYYYMFTNKSQGHNNTNSIITLKQIFCLNAMLPCSFTQEVYEEKKKKIIKQKQVFLLNLLPVNDTHFVYEILY